MKKWTVIRDAKLIENEKTTGGDIRARYDFVFETLFNPMYYKKNFNALWNGGNIKAVLKGKKVAVGFGCLATKLNKLVQLIN